MHPTQGLFFLLFVPPSRPSVIAIRERPGSLLPILSFDGVPGSMHSSRPTTDFPGSESPSSTLTDARNKVELALWLLAAVAALLYTYFL